MKFADEMVELDRKQEALREGRATDIPLDTILDRETDLRKLSKDNVANLFESIGAIGLIEPLVVDRECRLLAGAHRLAAIRELRASRPGVFTKQFPDELVPVRIMPIIARVDREAALGIEVAENAQRRNYTPAEIDTLAKKLMAAGFRDMGGQPPEGERQLLPAIAAIIGRSTRTVRRQLRKLRKSGAPTAMTEGQSRPNGRDCPQVDERTYAANAGRRIAVIIEHYQNLGNDALSIVMPLRAASQAIAALIESLSKQGPNAQTTE